MIHKQLWSPDSCGCIFEESWDDENPDAPHQLVETILRCSDHNDSKTSYKSAVVDSQIKNQILGEILEKKVLPNSLVDDTVNYNEETKEITTSKALSKGIMYKYYFTGPPSQRVINISFEGVDKNGNAVNLSNTNKSSINGVIAAKFGNGRHQVKDIITEKLDPDYKKSLDNIRYRDTNYSKLTAKYRAPTKEEVDKKNLMEKVKDFFTN